MNARAISSTPAHSRSTFAGRGVCLLSWLCLIGILCSSAVRAREPVDPRQLLEQLNGVSVDPSQVYVLHNARITRDRVNFYFNRGFVGFLTPINGEVTGAVFAGDGEVLLMPPDVAEKRSLAHFTQSPILEEKFSSVYLRFTDQTTRELLAQVRPPHPDDYEQPTDFVEYWNPIVHRLNSGYSARILQDLLGDRDVPLFGAYIQGDSLGIFQVVVDERLPEAVRVGATRWSRDQSYVDVWCSFPSRRSAARFQALQVGAAQARAYKIETRINLDHSLEGRTEVELESRSNADLVLVFELSRLLKVTDAKDEEGHSLLLLQNVSGEDPDAAARGNDWIRVVLPAPHPVGKKFRLSLTYQGSVITEVGNGVLYVGERGSWYPNRGLYPRAVYDLTFHYPEHLTLVATGDRVEETTAAGWKHSRWVSRAAIPVAGFNLGAYESSTVRMRGTPIEAYATLKAEASLERHHAAAQPSSEIIIQRSARGYEGVWVVPKPVVPLAPAALLGRVAGLAADAVRYFETLFGPFPYPRLAVSQVPGYHGQGWPGLVYLPTLSFLPESERSRMGLGGKTEGYLDEVALTHEVAHQWWGNNVGWQTYHDQWLSEGFASYASVLYLARGKDGDRGSRALMQSYKQDLLGKTEKGDTIESGGPIWLGYRLSNSLNPDGYTNIVYKKACWVIHMLRGLMTDTTTGSDERFFRMLRDFLAAYRGQYPSTQDFIRYAEKYMTRDMDLEKNRRLDWFFADWVYGTGIPTYKLEAKTRRLAPQKFVVEGTIEQSDVPPEFEMLVPVTATYSKDRKATLGRVTVGEGGGRFRFTTTSKPVRVAVDEDSILAVVR